MLAVLEHVLDARHPVVVLDVDQVRDDVEEGGALSEAMADEAMALFGRS